MNKNYLAGFIDGEGHIGIIKSPPQKKHREKHYRYLPKITIVNTHLGVLEEIKKYTGGLLTLRKKEKAHHKQTYSLQIYGKSLQRAVEFLKNRLIIKQKQLKCVKKVVATQRRTGRSHGYSNMELNKKESLYQECRRLNM